MRLILTRKTAHNNPSKKHSYAHARAHICGVVDFFLFCFYDREAEVCHVEPICLSLSRPHSLSRSPLLHFVPKFSIQKMKGGERRAGRERERTRRGGGKGEEPSWIPSPIRCQSL